MDKMKNDTEEVITLDRLAEIRKQLDDLKFESPCTIITPDINLHARILRDLGVHPLKIFWFRVGYFFKGLRWKTQ